MTSSSTGAELDAQDMLGIVRDSPHQWAEALEVGRRTAVAPVRAPIAVVITGMGGSGIAGDVARLAADLGGTVPVVAVKGYRAPAWLGPDTPVIAVSHSGNTEETLAILDEASRRGAPVHAVTSGGALAAMAAEEGWSVATVPGGRQPRASLPSLVTPVLLALGEWGVIADPTDDLAALPDRLAPIAEADAAGAGPARQLSRVLVDRVAVVLGANGVASLVAQRAACQIAENAEQKAFALEAPEFDHNALVGFATPDANSEMVVVHVLDPEDHERIVARRAPRMADVRAGVADIVEVTLPAGPWLSRFAAGVLEVDLASVHLALALDRDPTPVEVLVRLKATLAATT